MLAYICTYLFFRKKLKRHLLCLVSSINRTRLVQRHERRIQTVILHWLARIQKLSCILILSFTLTFSIDFYLCSLNNAHVYYRDVLLIGSHSVLAQSILLSGNLYLLIAMMVHLKDIVAFTCYSEINLLKHQALANIAPN